MVGQVYYSSANVSERQAAPPSLAISTVIFALRPSATSGRPTLWLPLVRRIREPFKGLWALPGGPLSHDESLQDAAARNLRETTGRDLGLVVGGVIALIVHQAMKLRPGGAH